MRPLFHTGDVNMGRRRTQDFNDPPRFHRKGQVWYHVTGTPPRIWTPLAHDRAEALLLWAERDAILAKERADSFSAIARRYMREVMPHKAPRTRLDNQQQLPYLLKAFGQMRISDIRPVNVREYMDSRGSVAKVRANREKALLSHIFNKAREWGYTHFANPCQGVKGFKETGRTRYVTDAEFLKVKAAASPTVADAMDLALLTAQRPADILKMRWIDVYDGALHVEQNKTGMKLAIAVVGELAQVLHTIQSRSGKRGPWIVQETNGQAVRLHTLQARFAKAKSAAGIDFQLRDLRAKARGREPH